MPDPVRLSDEFLLSAGGWREMKEARRLHRGGRVLEASYAEGTLTGLVRDRGTTFRARLVIAARTDVENLCTCPLAKRDGIICAHTLAVGLEVLDPQAAPASGETKSPQKPQPSAAATNAATTPTPGGNAWPQFTSAASAETEPARCHLILPPNVPRAWEAGKLTLGIEIESAGERRLLPSVPASARLFLDDHDSTLLEHLKTLHPQCPPGVMVVDRENFLLLLSSLPGHPRAGFGKKMPARIEASAHRPRLSLKGLEPTVHWDKETTPLIGEASAWVLIADTFHPVAPGMPASMMGIFESRWRLDPADAGEAIALLQDGFQLSPEDLAALPERTPPEVELHLEGSLNFLAADLHFRYAEKRHPAGQSQPLSRLLETDAGALLTDSHAEAGAIAVLRAHGFEGPDAAGHFVLKDRQDILAFHAHGRRRLDPTWKISTGERFEHAAAKIIPVDPTFNFHAPGQDWFSVSLEFSSEAGAAIPKEEIRRLLRTGQNHRKDAGGRIAVFDPHLIEELEATISDCDPAQGRPGIFQIDRAQAGFLRETASAMALPCTGEPPWENEPAEAPDLATLGDLAQTLRPYQREGVAWMAALASRGMGGILADDMGLGKTLQSLATIVALGARKTLVVCPSSLVHNWVAEVQKFTPQLTALAIEGPDRGKILAREGDGAEILVTSYALLRRDEKLYAGIDFELAFLDEAQNIKNPEAQVSKAAARIRARTRFALTGTPIENSVADLWSLMHFAMPGYLGARKNFAERCEKPIAAGGPDAAHLQRRLGRRIRPAMLRRLKSEVAADLPEKIEQVIFCELNEKQREVYAGILRQSRESILDAQGGAKRMIALTALLRLRQACCDLRLLGLEDIDPAQASVKLEALEELLSEALEGGHRVLVFSQFVEMLQVLVPLLLERGLDYCYLDGKTRNRAQVVARFQQDSAIPVFLISLKAGGVGLNLTGADTVIHLDPWWNPAVEAQATDRAHRIGQTRTVTSYKLLTRGTVEEKILAMQEKKKALFTGVLQEGGATADLSLNEEDIYGLFECGPLGAGRDDG
ncbi:MAG: DEAD/DEAH box helicase [Verrucomicrobiales bacterium]